MNRVSFLLITDTKVEKLILIFYFHFKRKTFIYYFVAKNIFLIIDFQ